MQLREYQNEIIGTARKLMSSGKKSLLIQSPTGSGKTLLTAYMLKSAASKGICSWFINHRRELIKQSSKTFSDVGVTHGIIAVGFAPEHQRMTQIASIQTLARRYKNYRAPGLIVWDECHHVAAKGWSAIHDAFPNAFHIGLTATPERLDGNGLRKWFEEIIKGPSVTWLIENGFLAPYKLFAPRGISVSGIKSRMGDFAKDQLNKVADKPTITGDAIKHYQKHASGKRAVVFCVSIEHSKHVSDQFNAAGIKSEHVDGETDTEVRDSAIKRFESGETKVLCNVELFGEGFDLPALECAILLRPTQSLGMYLQQVGRALRPHPDKQVAIILDHAGNCERHGLPDEEREWSLDGREGRGSKSDGGKSVKICPRCFAAQNFAKNCVYCGFEFESKSRKIQHAEGDLQEIDLDAMRRIRNQQQAKCSRFEDLVELGRKRGYKRPHLWAIHILRARRARQIEKAV